MITVDRCARTLCVALAVFPGCSGLPRALSQPAGPSALALPLARGTGDVQYLTNVYSGTLVEFDYPKSESSVGSVGFSGGGECTKGAGTFWVATSHEIAEFEAGGKTPIRVLEANSSQCAIDPATGDLAALISGGVVIFHKARGKGKVITSLGEGYFDGYDNKSDLFVDGFSGSGGVELVEFPKGSSKFKEITTSNAVVFPGSIQWDGMYLTVSDEGADAIYRYTVSGTKALLEGTVWLSGASRCGQTWIARPYVYCADAENNDAEVFKYPAGGSRIAALTGPLHLPVAVVSLRAR